MRAAPRWRARAAAVTALAATAVALGLFARMQPLLVPIGFVALVPALAVFDRAPRVREALAAALVLSVLFVLVIFGWFVSAIRAYGEIPAATALLVLVVLAPILEPQLFAFALARFALRRRRSTALRTALASAFVYVGAEWAIPKLFGDTLAHGLFGSLWMRQGADLAGAAGLTVALLLANDAVLAAWRALRAGARGTARARAVLVRLVLAAGLAGALAGYGAIRVAQLRSHAEQVPLARVALVQGDISRYGRLAQQLGTYEATRAILDTYFTLSAEALSRRSVDLIVWPETVYPTTFGAPKSEAGAAFDREIAAFVARAKVPLVFGAYDTEDGREFNAAIFLEPEGQDRAGFDAYRKVRLFPLTERVPAWLDHPSLRRLLPWLGTWSAGSGAAVLPIDLPDGRRLRVAPLICYDAVDPGLARAAVRDGAELLVTLSNDSWFAGADGPRLHLVMSAFRSIETRRAQVRVTNTGISAVIDATGAVSETMGVHERGARVAAVPAGRARAPFLRVGGAVGPAALVIGIALLLPGSARRATVPIRPRAGR